MHRHTVHKYRVSVQHCTHCVPWLTVCTPGCTASVTLSVPVNTTPCDCTACTAHYSSTRCKELGSAEYTVEWLSGVGAFICFYVPTVHSRMNPKSQPSLAHFWHVPRGTLLQGTATDETIHSSMYAMYAGQPLKQSKVREIINTWKDQLWQNHPVHLGVLMPTAPGQIRDEALHYSRVHLPGWEEPSRISIVAYRMLSTLFGGVNVWMGWAPFVISLGLSTKHPLN